LFIQRLTIPAQAVFPFLFCFSYHIFMPLAFDSLSHGRIAFGFFNIETDMILLQHYFLFAGDFCGHISKSAQAPLNEIYEFAWDIYLVEKNDDVGNLMGAIHGIDLSGFIGEVYKLFPFPAERENFKQNPEGFKTRSLVEKVIRRYGERRNIRFSIGPKDDRINIGEYLFSRTSFQELIKYVWMGGFPRWKDEIRPDYVLRMKEMIERSRRSVFDGMTFI
jgi:hypothetical protein